MNNTKVKVWEHVYKCAQSCRTFEQCQTVIKWVERLAGKQALRQGEIMMILDELKRKAVKGEFL